MGNDIRCTNVKTTVTTPPAPQIESTSITDIPNSLLKASEVPDNSMAGGSGTLENVEL